jgi:L-cysteine S-thiosulfotransferase
LRIAFLLLVLAAPAVADERRSGYDYMRAETRAMQDDDLANPGMLAVLEGEALWHRYGCTQCHTDMKGVAARYPALDARKGLLNLEQRINLCRTERLQAPALAYESRELLALTAYVGHQSRGLPVTPDEQARPYAQAGKAMFYRRQGQVNLACASCHEHNPGKRLGGSTIPQAHPTGYPLYRLEWQGVGSLQRRLRNCLTGIRAEAPPYGAAELVELELFLMWRASGMKLETPAVRP